MPLLRLLVHLVQRAADDADLRSQHRQAGEDDHQHQRLLRLVGGREGVRRRSVLCNDPVEGDPRAL